jgi:Uma2 family endonuclease
MADTAHPAAPASAEARPRKKRFTFKDVEAMWRAGVIDEGGKEELLDGELWAYGEPRPFTAEEARTLAAAGIIEPDDIELLAGDIWEMASEGAGRVDLKAWVNRQLARHLPASIGLASDSTLTLGAGHTPSPDFYLFPASLRPSAVRGRDVLLLIEIADTSLQKDLMIKGPKYREHGVREYWVVDLEARVTHVHFNDGDWPSADAIAFDAPLAPRCAPDLALIMAESGV